MGEKRFNIATFPVFKRQGKTFTSMAEWENLVCGDCGEKMVLEKENDYESVKSCPNCGRRDLLIKKIKRDGMMSEKRFIAPKEKDDEFYWNIIDTQTGKVVLQHISRFATLDVCFLLNKLDYECTFLLEQKESWKDACKQLKEQLQMIEGIIQTQITEKEEDLRTSVKGGMPTGGLYSEIEFLEKLKKECFDDE